MVLTDNVGKIIASFFRPVSGDSLNINIVNLSGNDELCRVYTTVASFILHSSTLQVQIGKGTTPATKQDFNIENPFTTAPESSLYNANLPSYILGSGEIFQGSFLNPTGGSGSISEVIRKVNGTNTLGQLIEYIIDRISINPVVPFVAGKSVTIEHKVFV